MISNSGCHVCSIERTSVSTMAWSQSSCFLKNKNVILQKIKKAFLLNSVNFRGVLYTIKVKKILYF